VQGVCYFIHKFPYLLKKKKKYIHKIWTVINVFLELRDIFKNRGVTAMIE
jgi:hypothetical protein